MYWIESERIGYADRVGEISSWVSNLGRDVACGALAVEIDSESMALVRTSHTVKIATQSGEEAVVLTKEEFLNEYGLFERNAAPRLRAAVERLKVR
jgi:hypothetical protein